MTSLARSLTGSLHLQFGAMPNSAAAITTRLLCFVLKMLTVRIALRDDIEIEMTKAKIVSKQQTRTTTTTITVRMV